MFSHHHTSKTSIPSTSFMFIFWVFLLQTLDAYSSPGRTWSMSWCVLHRLGATCQNWPRWPLNSHLLTHTPPLNLCLTFHAGMRKCPLNDLRFVAPLGSIFSLRRSWVSQHALGVPACSGPTTPNRNQSRFNSLSLRKCLSSSET